MSCLKCRKLQIKYIMKTEEVGKKASYNFISALPSLYQNSLISTFKINCVASPE